MRNTKTEYSSSERMSVVLPEMEQLPPLLSEEQFSALEGDILENGCYHRADSFGSVDVHPAIEDGEKEISKLDKSTVRETGTESLDAASVP